jgi:hypothetical protein
MDEHARKVGENEILYRAVNERIEDLNAAFGELTNSMSVICECGDVACAEQIELEISEYEAIRSDPRLFVIIPGHEIPDVEDVVERNDGYELVRKHAGEPAELAREGDERSDAA